MTGPPLPVVVVGASLAAEMILTGLFIDADRALRSGLISEIVDHSGAILCATRTLGGYGNAAIRRGVEDFAGRIHANA